MSKQGYTPNFKWSMADVDSVAREVAKGRSAVEISEQLLGTSLHSTPAEIIDLMSDMGVFVPHSHRRHGR